MATPLVIVDGKNGQGRRISVSIDEALWGLYCASRDYSAQLARKDIKRRMQQDLVKNTYDVKRWIYTEIAKPSLLESASTNNEAALSTPSESVIQQADKSALEVC